ncbi:MAG TPA: polymer-forming cytoskeletal protein [Bacteroidales bacterium]|nr:polymer-forming cytoskeletal protein [Bacteroidales bacterium]
MAKQPETEHSSINLVGSGTTIKGDVFSSGDIRIDGTITGFLESKGKVVVGSTGVIEGDVVCQNADISGNVRAKISVTDLLTLKASSRITGDILTGKLAIEPGAIFTGSCTMDKPKPGIMPKPEEKK